MKKHVILDSRQNHPIAVDEETYEEIVRLTGVGRICERCEARYDEERPEVAANLCLRCFLKEHASKGFMYNGPYLQRWAHTGLDYHYHTFLDPQGHLWEVSPDWGGKEPHENIARTLGHWDFILPPSDEDRTFSAHRWQVFGDVRGQVVVAVHGFDHEKRPAVFLLRKDDIPFELDKRKKEIRDLFAAARRRCESTKDAEGWYHPPSGWKFNYEPEDEHLYEFLVQIEQGREALPTPLFGKE